MANMNTISWIGCGKVGRSLARALKNAGYEIGTIVCKHEKSAREAVQFIGAGSAIKQVRISNASIHWIATGDDAIPEVVEELASTALGSLENRYFFHSSGALSSDVFQPLQVMGAEVGSIHPLQVFADPARALETLPGIYFAIEGTDKAMSLAVQIVDRLKGHLLLIPGGRKTLYHAAGVFASNYVVVLTALALHIMEELGEVKEEAYQAFLPLMVSALQNIESLGVEGALTGPISRGDVATVRKHLEALEELDPALLDAYCLLGKEAAGIAARGGKITRVKAKQLLDVLGSGQE